MKRIALFKRVSWNWCFLSWRVHWRSCSIGLRSDLGTGTGKSLAFTLPIVGCLQSSLNSLKGRYPCCLVLEPTRELAKQLINDFLYIKSRLLSISMFYGRKKCSRQEQSLQRGSNVLVVTSVRMKDFIRQEKLIVPRCEMFALDEVDWTFDMGFQINRCYSRLSSMKVAFPCLKNRTTFGD